MKSNLVHSVAIAEFDIDVGNTLSHFYPKNCGLKEKSHNLADLCLPDGAHIFQEDITYILIPPFVEKDGKKQIEESDDPTDTSHYLFGMSLFRNQKDTTVRRGAIQKSLLLLATQPVYNVFEPLMRFTLKRFMDTGDKDTLKVLYETLNNKVHQETQVQLWGEHFTVRFPSLKPDHFGGATLSDLVLRFKEETMLFWYALLLGKRIVFVGQPAREVGNCCLACPLLVQPLRGFTRHMMPYVALTDLDPLYRPGSICGSTNMLFEKKPGEWFDVCGSLFSGGVLLAPDFPITKITGSDREHIRNVMAGLDRGEAWVRDQFTSYTLQLLHSIEEERMQSTHKKLLGPTFADGVLFKRFLSDRENHLLDPAASVPSGYKLLSVLKEKGDELTHSERSKLMFDLYNYLGGASLSCIEELVDAGAVECLCQLIDDKSAQIRKYCMLNLGHLSVSAKGQLAILAADVLPRILGLLSDPMANVANSACYCLMKLSSLYIGLHALNQHSDTTLTALTTVLNGAESDLAMKSRASVTLLNLSKFSESLASKMIDLADIDQLRHQLGRCQDARLADDILQLLDLWGVDLITHPPSVCTPFSILEECVRNLKSDDADMKFGATSALLAEFTSRRGAIVLAASIPGCAEALSDNEMGEGRLSRCTCQALAMLADTKTGINRLLQIGFVDKMIHQLQRSSKFSSATVFSLTRLASTFCQTRCSNVSSYFATSGGVEGLVSIAERYYVEPLLSSLCMNALHSLLDLVRVSPPEQRAMILTKCGPLISAFQSSPWEHSQEPATITPQRGSVDGSVLLSGLGCFGDSDSVGDSSKSSSQDSLSATPTSHVSFALPPSSSSAPVSRRAELCRLPHVMEELKDARSSLHDLLNALDPGKYDKPPEASPLPSLELPTAGRARARSRGRSIFQEPDDAAEE